MSQIMWANKNKDTGMLIKAYETRDGARKARLSTETVVKVEVKEVKEKK